MSQGFTIQQTAYVQSVVRSCVARCDFESPLRQLTQHTTTPLLRTRALVCRQPCGGDPPPPPRRPLFITARQRRQAAPALCRAHIRAGHRTRAHSEQEEATPTSTRDGVAGRPSACNRAAPGGGAPARRVLLLLLPRHRRQVGVGGAGGAQGAGGDRVRGLDGGHGEQQRHRHDPQERLPAVRARHGRRAPAHGAVLQRPPPAGLHLRGARPAAARPGLPRPRLRHPRLRPRRLLRLRRHRPRQQDRRRPVGDPAVEGGGVLQGVPAAAPAARRAGGGAAHRLGRALRGEHRHQRLPRELLPARDRPVRGVHAGGVRGLPGGGGGAVPRRDPPAGRAAGHLRRAQPHRVPAPRAHPQLPPRRLHRGVQPGGAGLQRQAPRHAPPPHRVPPGAQGRLHQRLPEHARPHHQPFHPRAGERGGRVLRDGEGGDVVPVQRQEPADVRGRRQVLLLGLVPPHREGERVLRQEDAGPLLRAATVIDHHP